MDSSSLVIRRRGAGKRLTGAGFVLPQSLPLISVFHQMTIEADDVTIVMQQGADVTLARA